MRIYKTVEIALNETHRDISEMGILIHPKTYQDKDVSDDPGFETLELQNYCYTVTEPKSMETRLRLPDNTYIEPTKPWADSEFQERIEPPVNPGEAYKLRSGVWDKFLQKDGTFAYTYSERLSADSQMHRVFSALIRDPDSRQGTIAIWDSRDSIYLGGISRVPCSLIYQLQIRGNMLNLHYIQRSADFITHFTNDVYLALKFLEYAAGQVKKPVGTFTHTVFSLHLFKKDSVGIF